MSTDVNNLFGVKGIVAVITGGGSGLGLYVAKALDANGAKAVYIVGRRKESLEAAANEGKNGSIIPVQGDVTSKESLEAVAERVRREQGFINVLFANSGIIGVPARSLLPSDRQPTIKEFKDAMWEPSMDDFTQAYHVNVSGVFYTALAFLELLDEGNKKGNVDQKSSIIVTSSIAGFSRYLASGFAYSTSKAGTTHLVKMLATYLTGYRIRVNGIAPGLFLTEMTANTPVFSGEKDARIEGNLPKGLCPMERSGTEEDIVGAALYLMSKGGAYLSGNVIVTDGGRLGEMPAVY